MANELQEKLDAILEDKNTNLLPEHLKAGVTCLGVEGAYEGSSISLDSNEEIVVSSFQGKTNTLENSVEGGLIENFKIIGDSIQNGTPTADTSVAIEPVSGDLKIQVTNGTDTQEVKFALGTQLLRRGDYLADDGIHITRTTIPISINGGAITLPNGNVAGVFNISGKIYNTVGVVAEKAVYAGRSSDKFMQENTCYENPANVVIVGNSTDTLETLKTKFDGSTIEYTLATEQVVAYNSEQQTAWDKLKILTTYAGLTTVTTSNNIKPTLSGEYYKITDTMAKGSFEGTEVIIKNAVEDGAIEEFKVKGISTQDESLNIQNVSENITLQLTNGEETQEVNFPLYSQKLMKDSYLADDGIHHKRRQITLDSSNVNIVEGLELVNSVPRIAISKVALGWKEAWDINVCLVDGYKEITAYDDVVTGSFATNFTLTHMIIIDDRFTSLEVARELLLGTIIEINQENEYVQEYETVQQDAWDSIKQLTTYTGSNTITTTNEIKPILFGKYYMDVPQLPLKIKNVNGTVQIQLNAKNKFNINNCTLKDAWDGSLPTLNIVDANNFTLTTNKTDDWQGVVLNGFDTTKMYQVDFDVTLQSLMSGGTESVCISWNTEANGRKAITLNETIHITDTIGPVNGLIYIGANGGTLKLENVSVILEGEDSTYESYKQINLTDDQTGAISMLTTNSIILTSSTEGEVVQATDLTVTPSAEEQVFDGLYSKVIVNASEVSPTPLDTSALVEAYYLAHSNSSMNHSTDFISLCKSGVPTLVCTATGGSSYYGEGPISQEATDYFNAHLKDIVIARQIQDGYSKYVYCNFVMDNTFVGSDENCGGFGEFYVKFFKGTEEYETSIYVEETEKVVGDYLLLPAGTFISGTVDDVNKLYNGIIAMNYSGGDITLEVSGLI